MKQAALFLFLIFISNQLLAGEQVRKLVPYERGVRNFTYTNSFWLVSPAVFSDLFSAYVTKTNYTAKMNLQQSIIDALISHTNWDNKYSEVLQDKNKLLQKELTGHKVKLILWTSGGLVVGIGFTAFIYHIAGQHIRSIQ